MWTTFGPRFTGFSACVDLLQDTRFQEGPILGRLQERGEAFLKVLVDHQALSGGWAYYDFAPYAKNSDLGDEFHHGGGFARDLRCQEQTGLGDR